MKKTFDNVVLLSEVHRLVRRGYAVTIPVRGNSMLPFLADGRDAVVLRAHESSSLRVGTLALVRTGDGRIVLHRIVRRNGRHLWLQGDGNVAQVEEADLADVLAVAVAVVRKERTYPVSGRAWRFYSWCWLHLGHWRRYVLAVYRRLAL